MRKILLLCSFVCVANFCQSAIIIGQTADSSGNFLSYCSILIKGTGKGTTSNAKGEYLIDLPKGKYILVCQRIGYQSQEKIITLNSDTLKLDFFLKEQNYQLDDVVVSTKGEDPAYGIIRKTIAQKSKHQNELKKFSTQVYIKGQLQLRDYPKKFLGEKVDFEDGDTSKRKMIFLSETIANYSVEQPNHSKIEVISTRVSGNSNGFGFSNPQILSFYENILRVSNLNPRGFVSPIADNALNFYKYKFEGSYFENGKEINRIKVIPKRSYEPLFNGYLNIIEDEWRIFSVDLYLLKENQMQFLDTLKIEQIYVPLKNTWVIKQQVVYPSGKIFGFDFFGSFVQVYDQFQIEPNFEKKFFNNTLFKFTDSSNKRSKAYWDEVRPIPLLDNEIKDYNKKDSLEQLRNQPAYLDSLDRKRNKPTLPKILFSGYTYNRERKKLNIDYGSLLNMINFNTVEGWNLLFSPDWQKRFKGRQALTILPNIRYGFSDHRWKAHATINYRFGKKYLNAISFSGGDRMFQLNNNQPISSRSNTIATLWWTANYMKLYRAKYFDLSYSKGIGDGFTISGGLHNQNRIPLENTTDFSWRTYNNRKYKPNYPIELVDQNFTAHQSTSLHLNINWQPGARYVEFPDRKVNIGSKYPRLGLRVDYGLPNVFGSDVDYLKWRFTVSDNLNLKLGGRFSYRTTFGGFIQSKSVYLPDYIHFNGNRIASHANFLSSFQLAPYYQYSTTQNFYAAIFTEYHLNGLLTNKIPGFKKLNWFLVVGSNSLMIKQRHPYNEIFIGLDNILKTIRIDFVHASIHNGVKTSGLRFSMPLMNNKQED